MERIYDEISASIKVTFKNNNNEYFMISRSAFLLIMKVQLINLWYIM